MREMFSLIIAVLLTDSWMLLGIYGLDCLATTYIHVEGNGQS